MQWKFSNAFSVGVSSYGDRRGIEQFVTDRRVALQVLTVVLRFNAWMTAHGRFGSLSINEAKRTRKRQSYLFANRFILGVKVAVPFTSPHDEVKHGNAIDFGITMPDGSNRALYNDEFDVLHALVAEHGGTWTGVNFNEKWHHEMATRAELRAPYADARERLIGKPAKPAKPTTPKPEPLDEQEVDDMKIIWDDKGKVPTLLIGKESWTMSNLTVSGQLVKLPQALDIVRRVIRSDQSQNYPLKINAQELAIWREIAKKVR